VPDQTVSQPTAPLAGIVVVSLEQAIAAPFASRQLADLGATVIKIERPERGDPARHYDGNVSGQSGFFVWANRGKNSLLLDLKLTDDNERFWALVAGADVFIHNVAPDAAVRSGVDPASIRQRFPTIIAAEVSGYGSNGPRSQDRAYDLAIQAEAGVFDVTGNGNEGSKIGFSAADIAAGMYLFSGILAALTRKFRTGEGATISISMLEALTEWMSAPIYNAHALGDTPKRVGRRHAQISPYGTFALSDGTSILIAVQNHDEWIRLCTEVLQDAAFADDPLYATNATRVVNVDEFEGALQRRILDLDADVFRARLSSAKIANATVNTLDAVWNHPQLRARDRFSTTQLPGDVSVETLRFPVEIDGLPDPAERLPALGEHDASLIAQIEAAGRARLSAENK
jgi:itaconate CoA-transferase